MIELAMAGLLACSIQFQAIKDLDRMCFYQCTDSTKEFVSTNKEYQCPKKLYIEREPLKFKDQDWTSNRWTKEQVEQMKND